ncbi:MAG: diaminopropionate ammonia-lyase [Chloroflexi bacterium]|nr:MAG: diaminopropionate ammonia-lyase [Chloroflexota bacterium]
MGNDERNRRVYLRNGPRRALDGTRHDNAAYAFHRRLPGYTPTPLRAAPQTAQALGIGQLWVKHERSRFGLPAFKVLGAAWATYRALAEQIGSEPATWATLDDLAAWAAPLRPLTLVAATDGNHGRAVARMAALLGFGARIYVPDDMTAARRAAIASEGAEVVVVHGTYDDAVARSADDAGPHCMVISDSTWPGYEQVPAWVIEGYGTILWELEDQFAALGVAPPRVVAVQIGVGALAAAVTRHYRRPELAEMPALLGVEPLLAAGMLASLHAGRMVSVPGPHTSIMAGLNCGAPSTLAWPVLSAGLDALVAVEDERAREAMRLLAADGIEAGETGAAGVAGLLEAAHGAYAGELRSALGLTAETTALAIVTEGATDPAAYAEIVGRAAG